MGVKPEEIRPAKQLLENNKISITQVKPNLFAIASNGLKKNFNETLDFFKKGKSGTTNSSN